jgi:hypothetical protein
MSDVPNGYPRHGLGRQDLRGRHQFVATVGSALIAPVTVLTRAKQHRVVGNVLP